MSIGQQLAAQRKQVRHTCPYCGEEFKGIKQAVYCPEKNCRQLAHQKRAREKPENVKADHP